MSGQLKFEDAINRFVHEADFVGNDYPGDGKEKLPPPPARYKVFTKWERTKKIFGVTSEEICEIEGTVGKLPDDYRYFAENWGGVMSCYVMYVGRGKNYSPVTFFGGKKCRSNLFTKLDVFRDEIPNQTLPIAQDVEGNQFLLDLDQKTLGSVYFWDHDLGTIERDAADDGRHSLVKLASSFVEFIGKIRFVDE